MEVRVEYIELQLVVLFTNSGSDGRVQITSLILRRDFSENGFWPVKELVVDGAGLENWWNLLSGIWTDGAIKVSARLLQKSLERAQVRQACPGGFSDSLEQKVFGSPVTTFAELLSESLLSLKAWISQSPHLAKACTEDLFLATFLRYPKTTITTFP